MIIRQARTAAAIALFFVTTVSTAATVDVIVTLRADSGAAHTNKANARAFAQARGLAVRHSYGTVFSGFATSLPEQALAGLANNPDVLSISLDGRVTRGKKPDGCHPKRGCDGGGGDDPPPPAQSLPWGVDRIDAELNANDGAGVHVYIIDSGIDADHPDLAANLGNGYAAVSCRKRCGAAWDDDDGHGTHVAGTVGALDNERDVVGVAPGVTLHAVKVLDSRGSGTFSGIIAGVDWVASQTLARGTASIANMSLGGAGSKTGLCTISGYLGSDNMHRAICEAKNRGVVFVAAAGNDGDNAANHVPAAYDDAVITVSATSSADDWPAFSNWGDGTAGWSSAASAPVAIAAPGVEVLSTRKGGGTVSYSGTSMASPHVAGAAALFLASQPHANNGLAFEDTRAVLLGIAESTAGFANSSGRPHAETFLNAEGL